MSLKRSHGKWLFSQKHLWCLGSRLAVKTAWERYGVEESADAADAGVRMLLWRCCCDAAAVRMLPCTLLLWGCYRAHCWCEDVTVRMLSCTLLLWRCYRTRCWCEDVTVHGAGVRMLPVWRCCRARCWCEDAAVKMLPWALLVWGCYRARCWCEDVWGCCCAIPCCGRCGRCWCEDVAARYRAADGADGAGVRMLLRDTVLRTVRTVLVWGCCCAIPCCGRCGRCWCEDVAARYRAADGADGAGVRMVLRDTVLRTVRTVLVWGWCCAIPCCGRCGRCRCEDVAARYRAADGADGAGVRMLLHDTVLRTVRTVLVWGWCCAIP